LRKYQPTIPRLGDEGFGRAIAAVVAPVFSWKSSESCREDTSLNLFKDLQKLYNSDLHFRAMQKVWDISPTFPGYEKKSPITSEEAAKFVQEADRNVSEWKAINDITAFWRHVHFLVKMDITC
jgi:hypothetical protein